jgi:hypothetical protein
MVAAVAMSVVFAVSGWTQALARDNQWVQRVGAGDYDANCSSKYQGGERMRCFDCVEKIWNGKGWQWVDRCSK